MSHRTQAPNSVQYTAAPDGWKAPCTHAEYSLHQLSPYIGKIKSSIAADLVERFSRPGDLVVDPFSGAGTIPFEAAIRGRHVFGADISPYARILSQAKLSPPHTLEIALDCAEELLKKAAMLPESIINEVEAPNWVQQFFHPETLREAIRFAEIARRPGNEFYLASFLGILHHQRPGFLSFPSSHLVPYLRNKKYPQSHFPEMYAYRELRPRLLAKIKRAFKRFPMLPMMGSIFCQTPVEKLDFPICFDAIITSPPYMNALDYGRDNRLRLWFIDPNLAEPVDNDVTQRRQAFSQAIANLAIKVEIGLRREGYCVLVVGEEIKGTSRNHPSEVVMTLLNQQAPSLRLLEVITDDIPDVRRARRECRGVKTEHILVFQRR